MYSIEDLPNEILYRIFDNLDINSIISFSLTCKRYFNSRNNYNQYEMNFESISKDQFDLICLLIKPSNIISLTLSDNDQTPGQIKFFTKKIRINQFNRLKSLKLIQINENDLENLLKNLSNCSLNCFHLEYRQYFTLLNSSTISLLNEILSFKSLKKVNLDMRSYERDSISWPSSSHIQYLTLLNINFNQFVEIIENSNEFQSISLRNFQMKDSDEIFSKMICLKELKSFEIEQSEFILEKIESLIGLMNELIHLKLEGFTKKIDKFLEKDRLENLFQRKIKNLKTFQFFIRFCPNELIQNSRMIESFIEEFEKSFWISHLNCFVNGDWIRNCNEIHFYSIPSSNHSFKYSDHLNFLSFSTLSSPHQKLDSVQHLELNLNDLEPTTIQIKNCEDNRRLFPRLKSLKLLISDQCSLNCFESLSKFLHLENIVKVVLIICSRGSYLNEMLKHFLYFLKEFPKLNSLEMFNRWHGLFSFLDIHYFCSMIPRNLKHLDIDISDVEQIKILIKQLQDLFSLKLKFSFEKSLYTKEILQWLINQKINSTYISDIHYLAIWISQQSNQIHSNKRIKL